MFMHFIIHTGIIILFFQAKALGKVLFEQVCRQLNLLEADYFGLEYSESTNANVKVSFILLFFYFLLHFFFFFGFLT